MAKDKEKDKDKDKDKKVKDKDLPVVVPQPAPQPAPAPVIEQAPLPAVEEIATVVVPQSKRDIVQETLTWVGTPYHHQARIKGIGVDCAQLLVGVAHSTGRLSDEDLKKIPMNYSVEWNYHNREEVMLGILQDMGCTPVVGIPEPGDIIAFKIGRAHGHLGIIVTSTEFVHAELQGSEKGSENGKVVRVHMAGEWSRKPKLFFQFPKVPA